MRDPRTLNKRTPIPPRPIKPVNPRLLRPTISPTVNPTNLPNSTIPKIDDFVPTRVRGPERQTFVKPGVNANIDEFDQTIIDIYNLGGTRELVEAEQNAVVENMGSGTHSEQTSAECTANVCSCKTASAIVVGDCETQIREVLTDILTAVTAEVGENGGSGTQVDQPSTSGLIHQIGYGKRNFFCPFCHNKCEDISDLHQHCISVHDKKRHFCALCSKHFSRKHDLKRHSEKFHSQMVYKCNLCPRNFKSVLALRNHTEHRHTTTNTTSDTIETDPNQPTQEISRQFSRRTKGCYYRKLE